MLLVVQQFSGRLSNICIGLGLTLLIALLAACSPDALVQPGGQSRATPVSKGIQQGQDCGQVDTALNGRPSDSNKARPDGNCFWQAFQQCRAATLLYVEHSLDSGTRHTFTIKSNNGKCSISDSVQHYIVPSRILSTTTYTCGGLVMQTDGLHFLSCGKVGNVSILFPAAS